MKWEGSRLKYQNVLDGAKDMSRYIDLTGKRFGRLVALEKVGNHKTSKCAMWRCKCDCGKEKITNSQYLREGKTLSCGCLYAERTFENVRTHGMHKTSTYQIWAGLIQRCTNPKRKEWKDYGGRGIKVCKRWLKFENFLEDMGIRPKGKTLDRVKNNQGYCKGNCRWAGRKTQAQNNRMAKLNKKDIQKIHELRQEGKTHQKIADIIGCSRPNISMILKGERWM